MVFDSLRADTHTHAYRRLHKNNFKTRYVPGLKTAIKPAVGSNVVLYQLLFYFKRCYTPVAVVHDYKDTALL